MVPGGAISLRSCQCSRAGRWDPGKTPALLVFRGARSEGLDLLGAFQDSGKKRKCGARGASHQVAFPSCPFPFPPQCRCPLQPMSTGPVTTPCL